MTEQDIVIIGGGGHARSLLSMAPDTLRFDAYVDSSDTLPLKRLGDDDAFLSNNDYAEAPVTICFVAPTSCSMLPRKALIERYRTRRFATIISPHALVAPDTVIGDGTMIFSRAFVNTGVILGENDIVNTGAIVEHDVTVGNNTFIGPGAIVCGGAKIGHDVYIGAGAIVRNGIEISSDITVGMGATVIDNLTEPGVYAGTPARKIRTGSTINIKSRDA